MTHGTPAQTATLTDLIATLQTEAGLGKPRSLPPVHKWTPSNCGDIGLTIARDGVWRQNGAPFTRDKLVRLFSTILRRDRDGHYLVTPHEKVIVRVEDAPFQAVRMDRAEVEGDPVLLFTTNVGDVVAAGPAHPLRVAVDPRTGEPAAYVEVRAGLEARLTRAVWHQLADAAEVDPGSARMTVRSRGLVFDLGSCLDVQDA